MVLGTSRLGAQAPPILPSTRVVQAGPASLYPVISLRDVGTDSNVYNDGESPKEDFTYTFRSRLFAVVPIGSTRFMGTASGDFVHFQTYSDQSTLNGYFSGRYDIVEGRIRPFVSATFATYSERQGMEIDARARQTQTMLMFGSDVELTSITSLTAWVQRENTSWDRGEFYDGVSLAHQLNSTADLAAVGAKFRFTPLTTVTAVAELQRERFDTAPERDADSLRIAPSVEFENGAAFTGHAQGGFRVFRPLSTALEGYAGFVASAGLRYEISDVTRLHLDGGHDIEYSYDPLQPYYLETSIRFRIVQRIVGPVEGVGIVERWQLRHQRVGGRSFNGRLEDTTTFGGGVGFRMSREMELTFTIDRTERTSSDPGRSYERHRVLASINYGL
jgi:hypothetical protein